GQARILGRMANTIPPGLRQVIAEQAGVVSRRQVLRAGVSRNAIVSKVHQGRWQQLHPGVYGAFTGALSREVRLWAAVLYAGPGALLSHETAAEVLGLADRMCPVIHVTAASGPARRPAARSWPHNPPA